MRLMRFLGWLFGGVAAVALALAVISFIVWASHWLTNYLQIPFPSGGSGSPFFGFGFHGHVLLAIAAIGLPIAIWRGYALHKQSNTAQSNLLNERYQKGVEMLGSEDLSVRFGGIHALERLAGNDPATYHIPIMSVFSSFVRNWRIKGGSEDERDNGAADGEKRETPGDVSAVLAAIGYRSSEQHGSESGRQYTVDLTEARLHSWEHDARSRAVLPDFSNVSFLAADLSEAIVLQAKFANSNFMSADLSDAEFMYADFSSAYFRGANLSGALLSWANLADADFAGAKLAGTDLVGVKGLTQEQLNSANIDLKNPPVLTDAVDPATGKPLEVSLQRPAS